eukprot:553332_1
MGNSNTNTKQQTGQTQKAKTKTTSSAPMITEQLEKKLSEDIQIHQEQPKKAITAPTSFQDVVEQLGEASESTFQSYYEALVDFGGTEEGQYVQDSLLYSKKYGELRQYATMHKNDATYNADLVQKMNALWKEYIETRGPGEWGWNNEHCINLESGLREKFKNAQAAGWQDPQKALILFEDAQKALILMLDGQNQGFWNAWHLSQKYKDWAKAHDIVAHSAHSDYEDLLLAEYNNLALPSAHREYGNYYEALSDYVYVPQQIPYHGSSYNQHHEVNTLSLVALLIITCIVCIVKDIFLCTGCFVIGRAWPLKRKNVEDDHGDLV